jgi:hypothetical protein
MVAFNTKVFDMVLEAKCRMCAGKFILFVKGKDYLKWKYGEGFIQDLMPYLSASERELLISETCGDCFDNLFPPLDNTADE